MLLRYFHPRNYDYKTLDALQINMKQVRFNNLLSVCNSKYFNGRNFGTTKTAFLVFQLHFLIFIVSFVPLVANLKSLLCYYQYT